VGQKFRLSYIVLIMLFHYSYGWAADKVRWTPDLSYEEILDLAQSGSAYHMGLLGIYLRSGEAGCVVNLEAAKQWSGASLEKGHPFGSYNLANMAMLKGDFSEATRLYQDAALLLQRRASDGDPVAMYCMGEIDFQVMPTNTNRALEFFQKAADAGYPQAQATMGTLLLKGLPGLLDRDPEKGVALLSDAVRAKSLSARFNLGMAYYKGDVPGVPQNASKAVQWLQASEKQNFAEAQYVLGTLFVEGEEEIQRNQKLGVHYLRKAAAQNHRLARDYLAKMDVRSKDNLSNDGISEVSLQASAPRASNYKNDKQMLQEARMFYTGIGREKDYERAFSLLLPLAKAGYPEAARLVGLMKLSGKGTDKNLSESKQWLSVAAQKGDATAIRMLEQYKSLF